MSPKQKGRKQRCLKRRPPDSCVGWTSEQCMLRWHYGCPRSETHPISLPDARVFHGGAGGSKQKKRKRKATQPTSQKGPLAVALTSFLAS